jgi:hypothetical protein
MNLKELNSFKLSDAVTFHDKLNPKLWNGTKLRSEVREQLIKIAQDFLSELGVHDLDVKDITISGSNAAFSYTKHSDLDLHILVDMSNLPIDEVYKELFNAKKTIYNDSHDITIHKIPVELYVQDSREPVVSLGEYSIINDQWIRIPTKRRSDFDQTATKSKYEKLLAVMEIALKSRKYSRVKHILDTIKRYRQAGLDKGGEFSPENLAFKMLRSQGYITKLYDLRDKLHSEKLSFETMYRNVTDEDYDPNGPPPGPEFNPTMPAGTVKVDVSDVYDWYKLGQHISNLKGLGKHDFGKGPPSTILAFGSEDEEHKYIDALKKTGLTTTDIDPVDPKQPKGMPRQKVDPTYNVGENYTMQFASEKTPPVSPYAGIKDNQYRGSISESTNNYLWHGSRHENEVLVPRQANDTGGKEESNKNAIYATPSAKVAIAMGLTTPGSDTGMFPNDPQMVLFKGGIRKGQMVYLHKVPKDLFIKHNDREWYSKPDVKEITVPNENIIAVPVDKYLNLIRQATPADLELQKKNMKKQGVAEASGYIPSEKQKNDPRFKTALTVDLHPDSIKKNAKAFYWNTSRAGIPPTAKANGKI